MDKAYNHKETEEKIYKKWEEKGYFKPEINPEGEPYSIVLPPPNANAPLHFGHAMYVIEDILVRYHRMKGDKTLWLPGADHAGFETQFVFEKKLQSEGKSRFDFPRETLYGMIWDFVAENRPVMEDQLRKLGFSLDWSRKKFTLDEDIVKIVHKTFKKLYDDGLVYRAERLVNYCTFDGTSFSDLEVLHNEKEDTLYFIKYPFANKEGSITVATTRPETMFGDVAVAVNPKDKRYKGLENTIIKLPLANREIPLIFDDTVEIEFGTGAVKVTPGHDPADFERGVLRKLPAVTVIGFDGKMKDTGKYDGIFFKKAREVVVEDLKKEDLIEKEEKIIHQVPTCYKCKNVIQPLLMEQWFIKMEPLAKPAIEAVKKGDIKIFPKNFEKLYFQFLESIRDWNISRQVVWGIRIPAWKNSKTGEWMVTEGEKPGGNDWEQDEDTFDTWFSSSQWPFATLLSQNSISNFQFPISNKDAKKFKDYSEFYPTTVMETGYDILRWWVARMVMMGIYATGKVPFKNVVLHGLVNDPLGKKMSKSKGNVVNPLELVDKYGADAVRFALVYGTALGNDQALSFEKLEAMRNFSNKLWNIARFIEMKKDEASKKGSVSSVDKEWSDKVEELGKEVTKYLDNYQFNYAAEKLYEFVWHQFADKYIEDVKNRIDGSSYLILTTLYLILLKLLHPFMPFITEEIYQRLAALSEPRHGRGFGESLMIEKWPIE